MIWSATGNFREVAFDIAITSGSVGGFVLTQFVVVSIPSIPIVLISWVGRSIYQQFTCPVPESMFKIICEYAVEYHNEREKIKLDPHHQEKLEEFAEKIGVLKPKPTGPWKCKDGRLDRRYLDRIKKKTLGLRPDDMFDEFARSTGLSKEDVADLIDVRVRVD